MKKVYIETFGCQMNVSDSERAATHLEKAGHLVVDHESLADIVLLNTCSVREKAEHKLYTRIGQVAKDSGNQKIIGVMGCVAQLEGETIFGKTEAVNFVVGTKAVGRIGSIIDDLDNKKTPLVDIGEREAAYDWSVAQNQRLSSTIGFVPIIEGCNKFCTYCIVPFSRGREKSLPPLTILSQVQKLIEQDIKEVHLIGQNVNSYRPKVTEGLEQFKGATPFAKLLRAVAATKIERIKFTTSFPRDFHPDIVAAINEHENLCNWVHLPVQSGSNRILKLMRRGHSVDDYKRRIDIIKNSPRKISLTTDLIVGFPDETDSDFQDTVDLYNYCNFDSGYIFKYSDRAGTPSDAMSNKVESHVIDQRFAEIDKLQRQISAKVLNTYVGQRISVLSERTSKRNPDELMGHSTCHKLVNFKTRANTIGNVFNVTVTGAKSNSLYGEAN